MAITCPADIYIVSKTAMNTEIVQFPEDNQVNYMVKQHSGNEQAVQCKKYKASSSFLLPRRVSTGKKKSTQLVFYLRTVFFSSI